MIKLQDSNITDILPEVFTSDPKNVALGYALQGAMRRLLEYSRTTSVYAAIDVAGDDVLDMLAAELDTQYYDVLLDVEAKRKLVKNTLIWYGKAGTPAAVEELITSVFGEGRVEEWFDYGGEPFYFKVYTNATFTEDIRYTHDTYCRIVIRHASFDAARMLAARWKREISLEYLTEEKFVTLSMTLPDTLISNTQLMQTSEIPLILKHFCLPD